MVATSLDVQRSKVAALGTLGLRVGPSGLLFPYYIGVFSALADLEAVDQSELFISGCSGGALIGALAASGMDCATMLQSNEEMYTTLQSEGTFQNVHNILFRLLKERLPADAHHRASGRLGIQITQLDPWRGCLVSSFGSRSDLIDAVCTSCYIPFWSGPTLGLPLMDTLCCDGLTSGYFPAIPPEAEGQVDSTLKISSVPNMLPEPADISPQFAPSRFNYVEYVVNAISSSRPSNVRQYYQYGRQDVAAWASTL